ncbi:MAG: hypothetical protein K0R39_5139, partial [Symbiobacteriaceae bacterium]|nr:hypothetical protein [Symbiobacteriaceae bacterium]
LLERGLIKDVGRKEGPGRPILYGTTKDFLTYFGLKDLSELPPLTVDTSDAQLILRGREVSAALQPDEERPKAETNTEDTQAQ